jgi:hypothetical protein
MTKHTVQPQARKVLAAKLAERGYEVEPV